MKHVIENVVFVCDWALADCKHFLVSPELVFFNLRNEKVEQVGMVSDSPSSRSHGASTSLILSAAAPPAPRYLILSQKNMLLTKLAHHNTW